METSVRPLPHLDGAFVAVAGAGAGVDNDEDGDDVRRISQ